MPGIEKALIVLTTFMSEGEDWCVEQVNHLAKGHTAANGGDRF